MTVSPTATAGQQAELDVPGEYHINKATAAVGETFILLLPPLPVLGVSIEMLRDRQQTDSLENG